MYCRAMWTCSTRRIQSEVSTPRDLWTTSTQRSLSDFSRSRDIDLAIWYVWTKRTCGSLFELSASMAVRTSSTQWSLAELSGGSRDSDLSSWYV